MCSNFAHSVKKFFVVFLLCSEFRQHSGETGDTHLAINEGETEDEVESGGPEI